MIATNISKDIRGKKKSDCQNFSEELLIDILIHFIIEKHVKNALEIIGVEFKGNFLFYPEESIQKRKTTSLFEVNI